MQFDYIPAGLPKPSGTRFLPWNTFALLGEVKFSVSVISFARKVLKLRVSVIEEEWGALF